MSVQTTPTTRSPLNLTRLDSTELSVDWRQHLGSRGLLVVIVHGTWCHACLERLVWLRRRVDWLQGQGVGVLAISADDPVQVDAFHQSLWSPLPFALVSDPNASWSRALGAYDAAAHAVRPAVLLIDCQGVVRYLQLDAHDTPEQTVLQSELDRLQPCA